MAIFNELRFTVNESIFLELFKNPDKGFGFTAKLDEKKLTELQIETLNYLIRCYEKRLMGAVTIIFNLDGVGEIESISRHVETIQHVDDKYIIGNTY